MAIQFPMVPQIPTGPGLAEDPRTIKKKKRKEELKQSKIVGASTAGFRALASQLFTFYIRVPVKLFRPTRVE